MDIDIVLKSKQHLDHFLENTLHPSLISVVVRIATTFVDTTILLRLGKRLWKPVNPFLQWTMVLLACAIALATPLDAVARVRHGVLTWVMLFCSFVIMFCPRMIATCLTPARRAQARIERLLFCFAFIAVFAQWVTTWFL